MKVELIIPIDSLRGKLRQDGRAGRMETEIHPRRAADGVYKSRIISGTNNKQVLPPRCPRDAPETPPITYL